MQNISIYLEKFKSLGLQEKQTRELVVDVVKNLLNIQINYSDVDYKDGEVKINVSGSAKTAIFLNKETILSELEKNLDNRNSISKIS